MNQRDIEICTHAFEENDGEYGNPVIPPIYQTSLYTFNDFKAFSKALDNQMDSLVYSRGLNPTVELLEKKLAALERGEMCKAFGSGMGAISSVMMTLLESGDHVLFVNQIYGPTTQLLDHLQNFGVTYDQTSEDLEDMEAAIKPNTKLIYIESPASMDIRVADLKGISKLAKEYGILTAIDNSWSTPLFQKPLTLGIDLSIHSLSKYVSGHSDVVAGAVIGSREHVSRIFLKGYQLFGSTLAPQDAFLITRGLRTLPIRMKQHQENVLKVIEYLQSKEEVGIINHPSVLKGEMARIVEEQMDGYSGLLSFELKNANFESVSAFLNSFSTIQIGVSWGGFESLAISQLKDDGKGDGKPAMIRLSVGLEGAELIIKDLEKGFSVFQEMSINEYVGE